MYFFLDVETGGLDPEKHSLLEFYGCVTDDWLTIKDTIHLFPYPVGGYIITPEAWSINKFVPPIREGFTHNSETKLEEFLAKNSSGDRLTPVGWNVNFDLNFMYHCLIDKRAASRYVSYRAMDLQSVGSFLRYSDKWNPEGDSLNHAGLFIGMGDQNHTAKDDVFRCIEVLRYFRTLL